MSDHVESLTWLTDPHLEFCSHRTRRQLFEALTNPDELVKWWGAEVKFQDHAHGV